MLAAAQGIGVLLGRREIDEVGRDLLRGTAVDAARRRQENATMALDQSALTDPLDALRSGGDI